MRKNIIILICFSIIATSCAKTLLYQPEISNVPADKVSFENILVSKSNPFFADLKEFRNPKTKSDASDMVSLESLLNRDGTQHYDFKNYHIIQIPFIEEENLTSGVALSDKLLSEITDSIGTVAIKFLVDIQDANNVDNKKLVTTFIPTPECLRKYGRDSFSYIDKSTFDGIVIYSNLDGSFRNVYLYGNHPITYGVVCSDNMTDIVVPRQYLMMSDSFTTRSDINADGGTISASICIGTIPTKEEESQIERDNPSPDTDRGTLGGGGGGSSSGDDSSENSTGGGRRESEKKDSTEIYGEIQASIIIDEVIKYVINLSTAKLGYVMLEGCFPQRAIKKCYSQNRYVQCQAVPEDEFTFFDRWVGDFFGHSADVGFFVDKDIVSTAYFWDMRDSSSIIRPCLDKGRMVFNPLINMEIASTGGPSGLKGGTYGPVRWNNGKKKNHGGIDLYAEVGTDVYAMIDGKIGYPYVTEQPFLNDGNYPDQYSGDKDKSGNRIYYTGIIDGNEVRIGCFHLEEGNAVAINPRTGKPFSPGDLIYRGEIIAHTGRTGNAYNVPSPHLHLTYSVKRNGVFVPENPENLINGKIDWDEEMKKVLGAKITKIKCDSESQYLLPLFPDN
ncbi:MAG: M23 family metallopeptidase [Candidatus Cryptobacteroides sp.]